jgi:hypothetical protein
MDRRSFLAASIAALACRADPGGMVDGFTVFWNGRREA